MRKFFAFLTCISISGFLMAQNNVGIGTTTPNYRLHVTGGDFFLQSSSGQLKYGYDGSNQWQWGTVNGGADLLLASSPDNNFGTTRVTFTQVGNVGIGTSPATRLHVSSPFDNELAKFNGGNRMYLGFYENNTQRGYVGSWQLTNAQDFDIGTSDANSTGKFHLTTLAIPRATIDETGDFGIGTTSPVTRLHVSSTGSEVVRVQGSNPYISLHDNTNGYRGFFWYDGTNVVAGATAGVALRFSAGGIYRMTVGSDGRVSIGGSHIPATGYLLSVDGKIICEEARVQNSLVWPDYVFNDDYKLTPIDELEKIIRKEKHLPNIPSAAEVEKEGIALGDMNRRLVEKVEELTLYIIGLNKENKALGERIRKLEEK